MIELYYDMIAFIGAGLLVYVMQKTDLDPTHDNDHKLVRSIRRYGFTLSAIILLYTIWVDWEKSIPVLALLTAGVINLAVNAVALHMRNPPSKGIKLRNYNERNDNTHFRELHSVNFKNRHRD